MGRTSKLIAMFLATAVLAAMIVTPAFAGDNATVTGQVDTQLVSVTVVSGSNLDYGTLMWSDSGCGGTVEVHNSGTLNSDWSLLGHDASGAGTWTLASSPGPDTYAIDINDKCYGYEFALSTAGQTWRTNMAPDSSCWFNPILRLPTSSTSNGVHTFEIEILATQSAS